VIVHHGFVMLAVYSWFLSGVMRFVFFSMEKFLSSNCDLLWWWRTGWVVGVTVFVRVRLGLGVVVL